MNMEFSIKSEPGLVENTCSQYNEFLDVDERQTIPGSFLERSIAQKRLSLEIQQPEKKRIQGRSIFESRQIPKRTNDKLSGFLREKSIEMLYQEGCTAENIEKFAVGHDHKVESVTEYFNTAAEGAQDNVYQECESLSFSNTTEWLKHFQNAGISNDGNFEQAIVMNAIAMNEYHPEPEAVGGINLNAIYKFLSNALMGLPQTPLDETSAKFLSNEFQNLINEANTDDADNQVRDMKTKIEISVRNETIGKLSNMDPLNISTKELEQCYTRATNSNYFKFK